MNAASPAGSTRLARWFMARRSRAHNSDDSRRYYDWLDRAGEDMVTAELLIKDDRCYNSCAFHCQQAAEKALKAYLLLQNPRLLDGHNLTWLCKQAMRHDRNFEKWLDESAALNRYYIETRYPTDIPDEIDEKEIHQAFDMAMDLYFFICERVDEELDRREKQQKRGKGH